MRKIVTNYVEMGLQLSIKALSHVGVRFRVLVALGYRVTNSIFFIIERAIMNTDISFPSYVWNVMKNNSGSERDI